MKLFLIFTMAIVTATPLLAQSVGHSEIHTVKVDANGVTFRWGGGLGTPVLSVTIPGEAGTNCLNMFTHIDKLTRSERETFGLSFTVETANKTCHMQVRPIAL